MLTVSSSASFVFVFGGGRCSADLSCVVLKDELETTMRLVGITDLSQAHPGLINTLDLDPLIPKAVEERRWWRAWLPRARL